MFELVWDEDGTVTLKANNDKFIGTKKSGHLFANRDAMDENTNTTATIIQKLKPRGPNCNCNVEHHSKLYDR